MYGFRPLTDDIRNDKSYMSYSRSNCYCYSTLSCMQEKKLKYNKTNIHRAQFPQNLLDGVLENIHTASQRLLHDA